VTILGVGGLGSWTLCGLACAGVGRLRIVGDHAIDLGNLNRQLLYRSGRCSPARSSTCSPASPSPPPSAPAVTLDLSLRRPASR
jgi:molybdopterin/thiamine biosynthesis adenylyltransferase